nr:unnamed protein product [Spirometra erinaceieuropaei]
MAKDRFGVNDDWRMRLLSSFQNGDSDSFKAVWEGYCVTDSVQQATVRPLEFYLSLYFIAKNWDFDTENHPVYRELFGAEWAADLKKKLSAFLETIDGEEQPLPKILFLQEPDDMHKSVQLKQLQNRLVDAEKRASQAHQRFSKIQNDYQSLLGITTDLVDTLEAALRGEQIQGDVLQQICSRLVATQRAMAPLCASLYDTERQILIPQKSGPVKAGS